MTNGMIAAGDQHTADAAVETLAKGGNAVDAAVAAAFVSFIAEIAMVHLGGSGMAQIFDPATGERVVYDFFSDMPGRGKQTNGRLDFEKVNVDFGATNQQFYIGRGSVAVPGNIYGLCQMAQAHGLLPLETILQPAIQLARSGLHLTPYQCSTAELLADLLTHTPDMRAIFAPHGHLLTPVERFYIPHLEETLNEIAHKGSDSLRNGRLGERIVADQKENGGLITAEDLASYEVKTHEPIQVNYRGYQLLLPRPSSSGGVLTAFTLKLLSKFDLPSMTPGSVEHLQLLTEAMAATTRARRHWELAKAALPLDLAVARFLDPEFVGEYAAETALAIWKGRPSRIFTEPTSHENTSHISVVDHNGMAVSLTTTAGESAGYIVPETGFIPNNILGEEDLHPNGFHASTAGERISTMVTPMMVLQNDQVRLVLGSGGSIRIRSAILQVLTNYLDHKMPLPTAVHTPRIHLERGVLQCEVGYNEEAVDDLEGLGYLVNRWDKRSMYFGGAHSVGREGDIYVAAGDDRRSGSIA